MSPSTQPPFDTVEAAIADIAAGKLVIVTDDEDRENEGDLIMAASKVTPETVNMMIRYGSGIVCVPTLEHQLRRLGLGPMVARNRESHRTDFTVSVDTAFPEVVAGCADRPETWIDPAIARVYADLFAARSAHSVEVWQAGDLVGGLYGVQLGGVFFGESMFSRVGEASKVALLALVGILRALQFGLLDIQWVTDHLENFGAVEIRRPVYLNYLREAMVRPCSFPPPGEVRLAELPRQHAIAMTKRRGAGVSLP